MTTAAAPRETSSRPFGWVQVFVSIVACAAIGAASFATVVWINRTEPVAQTINAKRKSAALVETMVVTRGNFRPRIAVLGTVQAAREVSLSPRVGGQIVDVSDEFVPGGMVEAGATLIRLDPADFENALLISKSELEQAEALLDIESGRQSLAKKELKMLEGTIDSTNRSLVLRQPQIASIRAQVKSAEASVRRAELDLSRVDVSAPFDAQVLECSVNVGSQVSPGDELGRLVGIDEYWVSAAVPVRSLRWIEFENRKPSRTNFELEPSRSEPPRPDPARPARSGSTATLRDADAWGAKIDRCGTVSRMIGALDQQTRLAQVLITVPDPLGLSSDEPPLILGSLIDAEIEGREIVDVVRLPRDHLRDGDTVWVMDDSQLRIADVEVAFRDAQFVYIATGLADGDEVITTTLATVADGVRLKKIEREDMAEPVEKEPEMAPEISS